MYSYHSNRNHSRKYMQPAPYQSLISKWEAISALKTGFRAFLQNMFKASITYPKTWTRRWVWGNHNMNDASLTISTLLGKENTPMIQNYGLPTLPSSVWHVDPWSKSWRLGHGDMWMVILAHLRIGWIQSHSQGDQPPVVVADGRHGQVHLASLQLTKFFLKENMTCPVFATSCDLDKLGLTAKLRCCGLKCLTVVLLFRWETAFWPILWHRYLLVVHLVDVNEKHISPVFLNDYPTVPMSGFQPFVKKRKRLRITRQIASGDNQMGGKSGAVLSDREPWKYKQLLLLHPAGRCLEPPLNPDRRQLAIHHSKHGCWYVARGGTWPTTKTPLGSF